MCRCHDDDANLFLSDSHDLVEPLLDLFVEDVILLAQVVQLLLQATVSVLPTKEENYIHQQVKLNNQQKQNIEHCGEGGESIMIWSPMPHNIIITITCSTTWNTCHSSLTCRIIISDLASSAFVWAAKRD